MATSKIKRNLTEGIFRREVSDLNDAVGDYHCLVKAFGYSKTAANNPNTGGGGVVFVISYSEEYFCQFAVSNYGSADPEIYCRKYHPSHGWSGWYEINKTAI